MIKNTCWNLAATIFLGISFLPLEVRADVKPLDPGQCKLSAVHVVGTSYELCALSAKQFRNEKSYPECIGNKKWAEKVAVREAACFDSIMNRDLKRRLRKLQNKPQQARAEKKLQQEFRQAVARACDRYRSCEPFMYHPLIGNCMANYWTYRSLQMMQMSTGTFTVDESKVKTASSNHPFADYAKGLCALPKEIWKDHKKPSDCESRVLASIAYEENPCGNK